MEANKRYLFEQTRFRPQAWIKLMVSADLHSSDAFHSIDFFAEHVTNHYAWWCGLRFRERPHVMVAPRVRRVE